MESEVEDFLMTSAFRSEMRALENVCRISRTAELQSSRHPRPQGTEPGGPVSDWGPQIIEGIDFGVRSIDRKPSQGEPDGRRHKRRLRSERPGACLLAVTLSSCAPVSSSLKVKGEHRVL